MHESEEEDHYEPVRTSNDFSNNVIEYEINVHENKILSVKEYLDIIRQYLNDITHNHKTQGEWKNQLPLAISFLSPKNFKEIRTMHSNSDNMKNTV